MRTIKDYKDFLLALNEVGFTIGNGNAEGVLTLYDHFDDRIIEHTGDPLTDPWCWRMMSLKENPKILYGKFFFKKSAYITLEWLPYFLVVRQGERTFDDMYEDGLFSYGAKRVYDQIKAAPDLALHQICSALAQAALTKKDVEKALVELQMKLFITISGETYKLSKSGEPFGWPVTTFATIEDYLGKTAYIEMLAGCKTNKEDAYKHIEGRVNQYNMKVSPAKLNKFILG